MKVIYIMGAGHIGSTILDIVLASHPSMESAGEISKFVRALCTPNDKRKCACGAGLHECPFWLDVQRIWVDTIGTDDPTRMMYLQGRYETSYSGWTRLLWNSCKPSSEFTEYLCKTAALYNAVGQVSGRRFVVDSSLTPRRAYALAMNPDIDLYLIHLVRDGRGVIWSLKKPNKRTLTKVYVPAPASRTTRYWISANLQSLWVFSNVSAEKRQMIRYEDFVTDPPMTLTKIGTLVKEDLSELISDMSLTNPRQARHTMGGNRVRMQKDIRISPDFSWLDQLPQKDRRIFWRWAGWLARRFGYSKHPEACAAWAAGPDTVADHQ